MRKHLKLWMPRHLAVAVGEPGAQNSVASTLSEARPGKQNLHGESLAVRDTAEEKGSGLRGKPGLTQPDFTGPVKHMAREMIQLVKYVLASVRIRIPNGFQTVRHNVSCTYNPSTGETEMGRCSLAYLVSFSQPEILSQSKLN